MTGDPNPLLEAALAARAPLVDPEHRGAFRAFNGHLEGDPRFVVDVYGATAVVYRQGRGAEAPEAALAANLPAALPWLRAVAARAGGAARVVHTDLNARFLAVAKASYALNGFDVDRRDFVARDFFSFVRGAKLRGERFDVLVLDPPFFSSTEHGALDLNRDTARLINKVRPLVVSGGALVVVNNALYLSGADFLKELEGLCAGGWMSIDAMIGVPPDITGSEANQFGTPPVEPAPFAHSTKIAVLGVRHR